MSVETAVNGFGRIGMLYSRAAIDSPGIEVLAINTGGELDVHDTAVRLEFDSVHRQFGNHQVTEKPPFGLMVDAQFIALHSFRNPVDAPWDTISDKLVLVESTGQYLTRQAVDGHLKAGAKRVVITAPARDQHTPTIVRGVNDTPDNLAKVKDVVAVSSCSTNCIAPIIKVLDDSFGVSWGVADIPHAFTNSQRPLDGRGNSTVSRRGLASILPAATGSAKEVHRMFPTLDFFKSESMRINIPDGSVAMLTIGLPHVVSAKNVVEVLTHASQTSHKGIIGTSERGMFLERVIGQSLSSVIDLRQITADKTGNTSVIKLQAWFDNEWGYANRVAEVAKMVGQII
jgi:glyceraldehyde 3-phosphate dehydrogenase